MKKLLKELIEFETIADKNGNLHKVIDYVDGLFNDKNVHTSRFVKNNKPSIVITSKFTKTPKVILNGHLDVVPADYEKAFEPYEKNGKVYGRGAADMKGQVSAMITAFVELLEEFPEMDAGLMITTDEEQGGMNGVEYLLKEEGYNAEVAFVPDQGRNWQLATDEKGLLWYKITAKGITAHSSRPWEGENAINKCWKVYKKVRDDFKEKFGNLDTGDGWIPTINLGALNGGDAYNKVPAFAEMKLDIRFPDEVGENTIREIVEAACNEYEVEFENPLTTKSSHIDPENKFMKKWIEIAKSKNKPVELLKCHGGSDGRFFVEAGIPTIMTCPDMAIVHSDHEWINFDDLVDFKDAIKEWVVGVHKL